jgi:hypothetical protein
MMPFTEFGLAITPEIAHYDGTVTWIRERLIFAVLKGSHVPVRPGTLPVSQQTLPSRTGRLFRE